MSSKRTYPYGSLRPEERIHLYLYPHIVESAKLSKTNGSTPGTKVDEGGTLSCRSRVVYDKDGIFLYDKRSYDHAVAFQKREDLCMDPCSELCQLNIKLNDNVSNFLKRLNNSSLAQHTKAFQAKVDELYNASPRDEQTFLPKVVDTLAEYSSGKPKLSSEVIDYLSACEREVNDYVDSYRDCTFGDEPVTRETESTEGDTIPLDQLILPSINGSQQTITADGDKPNTKSRFSKAFNTILTASVKQLIM